MLSRRSVFLPIILVVLLCILLPIIFLGRIQVKEFNMASTLLPGDHLWYSQGSSVCPNCVIVYHSPNSFDLDVEKRNKRVSRLVGMPGDTIHLINKQLFINGDTIPDPLTARFEYRIVTSDQKPLDELFCLKNDLEPSKKVAEVGIYDYSLPPDLVKQIDTMKNVATVRATRQFQGDSSKDYYPLSFYFIWNRDQYGPLVVPFKGQYIDLSVNNVDLYRDIIENHEGNELIVDFRGVYINGEKVTDYVIKKDYYFVLDDNRDRPTDSRILGFIPEDHIVGRARFIGGSWQSKISTIRKFRPERIFKKVR